jgi:plasmid stability protein
MPNLHIRGVSEETVAAFKHKAEQTGKSLNETVRETLDAQAFDERKRKALADAAELRKSLPLWDGPSIVEMLREDRDSR